MICFSVTVCSLSDFESLFKVYLSSPVVFYEQLCRAVRAYDSRLHLILHFSVNISTAFIFSNVNACRGLSFDSSLAL